jgi:hypothetical protein
MRSPLRGFRQRSEKKRRNHNPIPNHSSMPKTRLRTRLPEGVYHADRIKMTPGMTHAAPLGESNVLEISLDD